MLKKFFIIFLISFSFAAAQYSSVSQYPGAFSRMGFSARGIAMGNAMGAVIDGNLVGYYNPAIASFQKEIAFSAAYTFLSFDRSLNFISFGKNFELGKKRDEEGNWMKPQSVAGISVGIINSGVSGIEERDNQGIKTGDLSTSENLFFVSVSNRFSDRMSVGITFKFYYYKLYENITSTGVGFDFGVLFKAAENLSFSALISDLNSKYKWNTNDLYGQYGSLTENSFPLRKEIGAAYKLSNYNLLLTAEFENIDSETNYLRGGIEYSPLTNLAFRAGMDNYNISNSEIPVKPAFGFNYNYKIDDYVVGIDYAYGFEPYSPNDFHVISLNFKF